MPISSNTKSKIFFIIGAIIIFAIHQVMYLSYYNLGTFHFDNQSALSRLIFGKIWFLKNGLSVPWFTPHICCGAPFFSNPQSEFYSPIQILFLFFKPLTTLKIVFFLYSLLSFVGSFLVLKNIFKLTNNASLIGATLFLFNHYFAFHYLSGHIPWGLFAIIPIFFYVSAKSLDQTNSKYSYFLIISSALIFAVIMHSGGTRIIMEILVSVYFLTLLHLINHKNLKIIFNISLSVLIGLLISSSKIYAAWSFVENITRNTEPIYFKSIFSFISIFFDFFFLNPKEKIEFASITANLTIEEFSFNISILPIIILLIYLRTFPSITKDKFKLYFSYVVVLSVLILILLNFPNTLLGSIVGKIPFLTNDWVSFRMLAPLIILFCIITAMMFDKVSFKRVNLITFLFISIVIIHNLSFDRNKLYKIFSHANLDNLLNHNITKDNVDDFNINKIITILDEDSKFDGPKQHDFFLKNESIQFCYYSVFGYDLEALKPVVKNLIFNQHMTWSLKDDIIINKRLGSKMNVYKGDPLFENKNKLNFINPSCYLNSDGNDCKNDFLFKKDNKMNLIKFLNYEPFEFKHLKLQIIFNYLSLLVLCISVLYFLFFVFHYFRHKKNPS